MHTMTKARLLEIIGYYRLQRDAAQEVIRDLEPQLTAAEIDGYKVLGRLRKANAVLRGIKAP